MKFLMFAASMAKDSVNKKLINLSADMVRDSGNNVELIDFAEYNHSLYNADIQNHEGFPKEITQFVELLQDNDGLIISSPEYNYSIPGPLKNLIDWISRIKPMPWTNQCVLLMSASPSLVGGNRGLWTTRIPLEACGAHVFSNMFSLAEAHNAFNDDGKLKDDKMSERLQQTLKQFSSYCQNLKGDKNS